MTTKKKPHDLVRANCGFPTPQHPYYHIRLMFTIEGTARYQIKLVKVNGVRVRDFAPYHNSRFMKDSELEGGGHSELVLRWDWKAGEESSVEVAADGPTGTQPLALTARIAAPAYGGYWDPAWKYYAGFVCRETAGIDRTTSRSIRTWRSTADRVQDPERELRVVAVDPAVRRASRGSLPGPRGAPLHGGRAAGRGRVPARTTFQLAFFADVPADSARVYLAFYGNPKAKAPRLREWSCP